MVVGVAVTLATSAALSAVTVNDTEVKHALFEYFNPIDSSQRLGVLRKRTPYSCRSKQPNLETLAEASDSTEHTLQVTVDERWGAETKRSCPQLPQIPETAPAWRPLWGQAH